MLSPEDNDLLSRVGPGTPMGELFRRFWIPALIPEELQKWHYNANHMQGFEGEIDTCHTTFLHRFVDFSTLSLGLEVAHSNWQNDGMPSIHIRPTDYGFYYGSQRDAPDGAYN